MDLHHILILNMRMYSMHCYINFTKQKLLVSQNDAEMAENFGLAMAGPDEWRDALSDEEKFKFTEPSSKASNYFIDPLGKLATSDIDGRKQIVKSALQNYNNGKRGKKLDRSDLNFILRVANGKSTDPENPIWGWLSSAAQMTPESASADVFKKFSKLWDIKSDPRPVMKQAIIDQRKQDKPELANYEIGQIVKRKSGSFEMTGFDEIGNPQFRKK